jgi:hypothetical protein
MSSATGVRADAATAALGHLRAALDELLDLPFTTLDRDQLLNLCSGVETQARRLPAFDHHLIAELDERHVAGELTMRDTATLLHRLLRLSAGEAKARTAAAVERGPRRGLTGDALPSLFPAVAAAEAAGDISPAHARVITAGISALPPDVEFTHGRQLEATLVEQARHLDPNALARQIRVITERLDTDGTAPDDREHQRRREVHLHTNADGSGELKGHLTPMATATWSTILDALSAPAPAEETGEPDPRTAGQRRHDALLDAGHRILRSGDLPDAGGTPVTILIRMNETDLRRGRGCADTEHGDLIDVAEILRNAGDGAVLPVLLNPSGGIVSYGRSRRLATAAQRRALAARDGGCSFPGCTIPASWSETHHVQAWADGGNTDLDNMTLVCGYHHREFSGRGWDCLMINGVPHWRPPAWADPDRKPRRNTTRHVELWFGDVPPPG